MVYIGKVGKVGSQSGENSEGKTSVVVVVSSEGMEVSGLEGSLLRPSSARRIATLPTSLRYLPALPCPALPTAMHCPYLLYLSSETPLAAAQG
jgi:hypothetical protein